MTSTSNNDLLSRIQKIRVNSRRGRRSPHKPLLLLLAIGRQLNGYERLATFKDIEGDLNGLIRRFGLPDSRENAYHPFWHLRNDGIWQIDRPELVKVNAAGHATISDLREYEIRGGLEEEVVNALESNPNLAWGIVRVLLDGFFPVSLHNDVLRAVGLARSSLPGGLTLTKSGSDGRDRRFREVVLTAYESRCAVCEFDLHIDENAIGLEAAHIKWHFASGPASIRNGMALCVIHHKLFDSGLFTVLPDFTVLVGGPAEGSSVEELLDRFGGSVLKVVPDQPNQRPATEYLEWHRRAVFRAIPVT